MDVSVIIVNWNTRAFLAKCLQSVPVGFQSSRGHNYETIVVDNASSDDSVATVRNEFAWAHLIANSENIGFASANNQAIRKSTGRYVVLLNPDTVVQPNAINTLIAFLEANPEVGAVGPRLLNPDGKLQVSCYPAPTLSRELWRLLHLDSIYPYGAYPMHSWSKTAPRQVDVVQGACLVVRRTVFEQVGLLDESYFVYTEEVDLCSRVRQAGWSVYWMPSAEVVHYGGQSTQQIASAMFLQLYQSKILYFRKHHGSTAAHIYKLIIAMVSVIRLALSPLTVFESPMKRRRHLALARNYGRLLIALPIMASDSNFGQEM